MLQSELEDDLHTLACNQDIEGAGQVLSDPTIALNELRRYASFTF